MASPQTTDGYTMVANELLGAIYKHDFKATQFRVVFWLIRHTYGWSRKFHGATMREISSETKVPTASVGWALATLINAGVIVKDEDGKYGINKDYEKWALSNPLDKQSCPTHWTKSSNPLDKPYPYSKEKKEMAKSDNSNTIPPKLEWVIEYAKAEGFKSDPEAFFDHHETRGWLLKGGQRMKNWQSAIRNWERMSGSFTSSFGSKPKEKFVPTIIPDEEQF